MLNDTTRVKSAYELEQKYRNFLLKIDKNIEDAQNTLTKVNNSINSMISSLVINLGDLLDTQSDISLWFYEGEPTLENSPYIDWQNKDDHNGDFYYDTKTGYVYKYTGEWEKQSDNQLVQAMALTNAAVDVDDHERKVFFKTPIPPYSSGDWWVQDDGTLKICQISRNEGDYQENDFISSNEYGNAIATSIIDELGGTKTSILGGTVIEKTSRWVKFTDLETGGTTVISGDNITTGEIKSKNYVKDKSGSCFNLTDGTISTPSCDINKNLILKNGGEVITDKGLYTNLQFKSEVGILGFYPSYSEGTHVNKGILSINCYIPPNFTIKNAYLTLHTFKTDNFINKEYDVNQVEGYGKLNNIRLYSQLVPTYTYSSSYGTFSNISSGKEITNAFGSESYSETSEESSVVSSIDLTNFLNQGKPVTHNFDENIIGTDLSGKTITNKLADYFGVLTASNWDDWSNNILVKGEGASIVAMSSPDLIIAVLDNSKSSIYDGDIIYNISFTGSSGGKLHFVKNVAETEFKLPDNFGKVVSINRPTVDTYLDDTSTPQEQSITKFFSYSAVSLEDCRTNFQLETADSVPTVDANDNWATTVAKSLKYSYAILDVFGYTKIGG